MVQIRKVNPTDLRQIKTLLEMHGRDFDPPFTRKKIEIELGQIRRYGTALVAVEEKKIVGFIRYGHSASRIAMLKEIAKHNQQKVRKGETPEGIYQGEHNRNKRHGYIFSMLVSPPFRGRGIGGSMLVQAEKETRRMRYANNRPLRLILLTCHEMNRGTQRLAKKCGFGIFGKVKSMGRKTHTHTVLHGKPLRRRK